MYGSDWVEVATGKVTFHKDNKTDETIRVYKLPDGAAADPVYFIMANKKLRGCCVPYFLGNVFSKLTAKQIVVVCSYWSKFQIGQIRVKNFNS